MNFVGYTYKAGVEAEKSMLVNVLKELDNVSDQQFEPGEREALAFGQAQSKEYLVTENSERSDATKQKGAN